MVKEKMCKNNMFKDKKGLSKSGHKTFSIAIFLIFIYFLKKEEILSVELLWVLIFHLPVYMYFALFPDILEKGGRGLISHRKFFHSLKLIHLGIISIPFLLYYSVISEKTFFDIANNYSLILAGVLGHIVHGFGDSLTSRLPR